MLANLFLHYALDTWLAREYPTVAFERYADDAVVHCRTEAQARQVLAVIENRMRQVGLRLHPTKTKIVYCKDGTRRGRHDHTAFTFLGYTFRARQAQSKNGDRFTSFLPAISKDALKKISREVHSWRLHRKINHSFTDLARKIKSDRGGLDAVLESAGINRHGVGDERALHRRSSDPRWPRAMRW